MKNNQPGNKVAAITGATGAIGKAIALALASMDYSVVLIGRDRSKCSQLNAELSALFPEVAISFQVADLSDQQAIQALADRWEGPLQVLINNAAASPPVRQETSQGIEMQFATNVLGYFWMTNNFSSILSASAPARVVNVASYWAGGLDLTDLEFKRRPYHNHDAYRQSKQANRMLTPVFSERLKKMSVTVNACHPGDVNSQLSNDLGFGGSQSPAQGAKTPVWLAASKEAEESTGKYFENLKETFCPFGNQLDDSRTLYELCASY